MAAGLKMSINIKGFKETERILNTEELAGPPWRTFMEAVGALGADAIRAGAPMRSGLTINRTSHKVQNKPLPRYSVFKTSALKRGKAYPGGYPYPRITNYSPYAMNRVGKDGARVSTKPNPNRGWFERSIKRVERGVEALLQHAADDIARRWGQ